MSAPERADVGEPEDALEIGRIVEPWGLKGWFRVHAYASEPLALLNSRRWHLQAAEPMRRPVAAARRGIPEVLDIRHVREHGDGLVAAALGIDDRNAADGLRGARIFLARSTFPATGKDEFYWADLIGVAVVNRQGDALGTVLGLIENGPQTVLRVQAGAEGPAPQPSERLIPFVASVIDDVDLPARRIVVDWGLDY
ncbi:MAG: ribosome maturation factor RimM [Pseudomonadota bacterium]|nr:ribosome maturation factor RimM [Pseudomonadota bacterium]